MSSLLEGLRKREATCSLTDITLNFTTSSIPITALLVPFEPLCSLVQRRKWRREAIISWNVTINFEQSFTVEPVNMFY